MYYAIGRAHVAIHGRKMTRCEERQTHILYMSTYMWRSIVLSLILLATFSVESSSDSFSCPMKCAENCAHELLETNHKNRIVTS